MGFVTMRLGLFAINYGSCADPATAVSVAQHAELAGFESVWTGEHIVLARPQPQGSFPPELPFLDTGVALTLIAAHTTTLKIGSGVIVLPLRNPVLLAKELASIDVVSNGRLIVGVGAGYLPEEFGAVGVPLAGRGARMDDSMRALRALWAMEHPRHHGTFASFEGIDAYPRPLQTRGPALVVGGESRAALARAVTLADGWYGFGTDPTQTAELLEDLRRATATHSRPPWLGALEITVTPRGRLNRSIVDRYEELGVDRLVLLPDPDADWQERHRPVPVARIMQTIEDAASLYL